MLDIEEIEYWISRYENEANDFEDCIVLGSLYSIRENLFGSGKASHNSNFYSEMAQDDIDYEKIQENHNRYSSYSPYHADKNGISSKYPDDDEVQKRDYPSGNVQESNTKSIPTDSNSKESVHKLNREMANKWASSMKNADGTTGAHWTMAQTNQIMEQKKLSYDPVQFYLALNATYSDFSRCFRKYNITSIDAYIDFAVAFWLEDKDAVEDKLAMYYTYVVKH